MLKKAFSILFAIIGTAAFCYGLWLMTWGLLSKNWPSTTGRVLSSAYDRNDTDVPTTYGAAITYEYSINSQRYVSKRISFGSYSSSDSGHAHRILSRYPAGSTVTVYYNPGRPSMAVLEQGVDNGAYIALGVGAAFVGFVLFMRLAQKQDAEMASSAVLDLNSPTVFQPTEFPLPGAKRIEVSRDQPRVLTNYPPYAIILGAILFLAGLALAYFAMGRPDGVLLVMPGLVVAAAGASLAGFAFKGLRLRNMRRQAPPGSPWQYDYPWDRRGTGDNGFKQSFRMLYALAMMSAFLVPIQVLMLTEVRAAERLFLYFIFGFFDLALLAVFGRVVYLFTRALKFGRNRVLFHSFPLRAGGDAAVSFVADKLLRNQSLHAELQCIREYYEWSGSGNSRTGRPVFELLYSQKGDFRTDGSGFANLTFPVPANAPSTDLVGSPPCYWELEITAKLPGIDYRGIFLLPIY